MIFARVVTDRVSDISLEKLLKLLEEINDR
jgi:hypothetical protein